MRRRHIALVGRLQRDGHDRTARQVHRMPGLMGQMGPADLDPPVQPRLPVAIQQLHQKRFGI